MLLSFMLFLNGKCYDGNVMMDILLERGNLQPVGRYIKTSVLEGRYVKQADFS